MFRDKIIKLDESLEPLEEYNNHFSRGNTRVSLNLTCNQDTFFAIPKMPRTEEHYYLMKEFVQKCFGPQICKENDMIHSCTFNCDDNIMFIVLYNLIIIIKNGTEFSYIYFKDKAIVSAQYDNSLKQLIVGYANPDSKHFGGSIDLLSDEEIVKKSQPLNEVEIPFDYYQKMDCSSPTLIADSGEIKKRKK